MPRKLSQTKCTALPNGTQHPLCDTFGDLSPMEVEYTVKAENGTSISVWMPVSLKAQTGSFMNVDCKPNPKDPKAPVCVNGTRKAGWNVVSTHAELGGKHPKNAPPPLITPAEVIAAITGIRYAWGATACCPGQDRGLLPCQPNSCPIRGYNSTLPAAPFMAKVVNGKCSCTPPQKCDA
jgi:hypothetical protein